MADIELWVHDNGFRDCGAFCCKDLIEELEGSGIEFNVRSASDAGNFLPSISVEERFYAGIDAVSGVVEQLIGLKL